jgi:hypothetical protein
MSKYVIFCTSSFSCILGPFHLLSFSFFPGRPDVRDWVRSWDRGMKFEDPGWDELEWLYGVVGVTCKS